MKALGSFVLCAALVMSAATALAADTINAVLTPYFRIQSALVDDRIDTIKDDALLVAQEAGNLGASGKSIEEAATALSQTA